MKIKTLYIYPVKSIRGCEVPSAPITARGFPHDRQFMLLKVHHEDQGPRYENMHVSIFASMCLFSTAMHLPKDGQEGTVEVTYRDPTDNTTSNLSIPLEPDTTDLDPIDVTMHQSPTSAQRMPKTYSQWFSARFGFEVVLAYLGQAYRPVLGNIAPNASVRNPIRRAQAEKQENQSWLSGMVNKMPGLPTVFNGGEVSNKEDYEISFADCSPYLIVSQTSLDNVSDRLDEGEKMNMEKFRPNMIVEGAEESWDEDYWGEVCLRGDAGKEVTLQLTANCVRCTSINVDFETGEFGKGPSGSALKKLSKDRRVDLGHKYSPVFGRYAFLPLESARADETFEVSTGDEVEVTKRNAERTTLMWPGIGQTPKTDKYPVC